MATQSESEQSASCAPGKARADQIPEKRSSLAANRIKIQIGLPRSSDNPKPRVFDLTIPSKMTSGELKGFLAEKFNKNKDKWEIVVSGGDVSPQVLEKDRTLVEFSSDKTKRLYFYPGIFEK